MSKCYVHYKKESGMVMKEKRKLLFGIGILIGIITLVGVSYAVWQLTLQQTEINVVTTGCFQITFTDKNPIQLSNVFPMNETKGKALVPYEFTITNTCNTKASYQVNLEVLNTTTLNRLDYVRVLLNQKGALNNSSILSQNESVVTTIENASSSYLLENGVLNELEEKNYEVRLWLDENTPAIEDVMNKILESKVSITTSYQTVPKIENMILARYTETSSATYALDNSEEVEGEVIEGEEEAGSGEELVTVDNYEFMKDSAKIIFQNTIRPIDGVEPIDISQEQDGRVLAYVDASNPSEKITYIMANGKIMLPDDCSSFFMEMGMNSIEGFEHVDSSKVSMMQQMFSGCGNLTTIDLRGMNISNVTHMNFMFENCTSLTSVNLSGLNTSSLLNLSAMFSGCGSLTSVDLSSFNTQKVYEMASMFSNCTSLTNITYGTNFVHKADMDSTDMFLNCSANKPTDSSWNGVF